MVLHYTRLVTSKCYFIFWEHIIKLSLQFLFQNTICIMYLNCDFFCSAFHIHLATTCLKKPYLKPISVFNKKATCSFSYILFGLFSCNYTNYVKLKTPEKWLWKQTFYFDVVKIHMSPVYTSNFPHKALTLYKMISD